MKRKAQQVKNPTFILVPRSRSRTRSVDNDESGCAKNWEPALNILATILLGV